MKKTGGGVSTSKPDRKTVERNRRLHMKTLCFKLASLIPCSHFKHSKEIVSQHHQLEIAATYIEQLRERIEKLKEMKEQLMKKTMESSRSSSSNIMNKNTTSSPSVGLSFLPLVQLRDMGSSVEVILITGLNKNFMLYEVISILEQEGAEVLSASFATVGTKIFHILHARAIISRIGVDTARVSQRLQEMISHL